MKKMNKKGFTLAELLIVVAIIAVLVAIAIPVFTAQLEKSREATDVANIRSAYATIVTTYLETGSAASTTVPVNARQSEWQTSPAPQLEVMKDGSASQLSIAPKISGNYTVSIDASGSITVN